VTENSSSNLSPSGVALDILVLVDNFFLLVVGLQPMFFTAYMRTIT
jgi:hypothetical protein